MGSGCKYHPRRSFCLLAVALNFFANFAEARTYNWQNLYGNRDVRISIPNSVKNVRGIIILGNPAGGSTLGGVIDVEIDAIAVELNFAVLGTRGFTWDVEIDEFEDAIQSIANASGKPELVVAPWLPTGHSNGGQMSYGFNTLRHEKVIGFITAKGGFYNEWAPEGEMLRTPGMLIAGEKDQAYRRDGIKELFDYGRPREALWAWVEEEGTGHAEGNTIDLKLPFLLECYRLRYPTDQSPVNGPVKLKQLHEQDGWLVDHSTWRNGITNVFPASELPPGKSRLDYGWVPSERIAKIYQAFSSYNKVGNELVTGTTGVITGNVGISYQVDLTGYNWAKVSFFEGKRLINEVMAGETNIPSMTYYPQETGLYVNYAMVTMRDNSRKMTFLRRVFYKGVSPVSPYQKWANANLPESSRAASFILPEAELSNLERYAYGLGTGVVDRNLLPSVVLVPGTQSSYGIRYVQDSTAMADGLLLTPQYSFDLRTWRDMRNPTSIDSYNYANLDFYQSTGVMFRLKIEGSLY
jgi:hypothetical protein